MMMTKDEWLDRLQEIRVEVATLPDDDPRKAVMQTLLKDFVEIEKTWTELDEIDPDRAERVADKIVRLFREGH